MWIKICANTNLEDAQYAARLGADAVGFVFAASPRRVTPAEVAAITPHLPVHLERIGVFPALPPAEILSIAAQAGLTGIQLHGSLDLTLARGVAQATGGRLRIIQTLHWTVTPEDESSAGSAAARAALAQQLALAGQEPAISRVLVDSKVGHASGGTGIAFDWQAARSLFDTAAAAGVEIIAAGGLTPQNVSEAIRQLHPWGVDVASGIESAPGRKSHQKLRDFIANARAAV